MSTVSLPAEPFEWSSIAANNITKSLCTQFFSRVVMRKLFPEIEEHAFNDLVSVGLLIMF